MGERGPKPMPTALRLLNGGASSRGVNKNEPKPPRAVPVAPPWITGYALEEWDRVAEDLFGTGVYANVDQTMLAAYCLAYKRWRHAEEDLDKAAKADRKTHGAVTKTSNGNMIHSPLLGAASSARRDMARLAAEFGLTPSSRTTINAGKEGGGEGAGGRYFPD